MFGTITDVFMSIIGITILLACFNTLFISVFNTIFAKKLISYISLMIFIIFTIGGLFFGKQNEEPFYIGFLIFLILFGFVIGIYMLKNFIKSVNESIEIQETEKQCRSCKYFEECDECFVKNCPDYVKAEPEEFDVEF